jgi:hypothetical protein
MAEDEFIGGDLHWLDKIMNRKVAAAWAYRS